MPSSSTKTALSAMAALLMVAGIATGDATTISISGCHTSGSYSYEARVYNYTSQSYEDQMVTNAVDTTPICGDYTWQEVANERVWEFQHTSEDYHLFLAYGAFSQSQMTTNAYWVLQNTAITNFEQYPINPFPALAEPYPGWLKFDPSASSLVGPPPPLPPSGRPACPDVGRLQRAQGTLVNAMACC